MKHKVLKQNSASEGAGAFKAHDKAPIVLFLWFYWENDSETQEQLKEVLRTKRSCHRCPGDTQRKPRLEAELSGVFWLLAAHLYL